MTMVSAAKARTTFTTLLKKAAAGESFGIRYGKKVVELGPRKYGEDTSYAEKEYGVTKAELNRFVKRMNAQTQRDIKAGKFREYDGDIEAILKD